MVLFLLHSDLSTKSKNEDWDSGWAKKTWKKDFSQKGKTFIEVSVLCKSENGKCWGKHLFVVFFQKLNIWKQIWFLKYQPWKSFSTIVRLSLSVFNWRNLNIFMTASSSCSFPWTTIATFQPALFKSSDDYVQERNDIGASTFPLNFKIYDRKCT